MRLFGWGTVTDEDLLQQLQGGATDALAVLFDRHWRLVFSVAQRLLRDSAEAEDLMQEVFLEIYRDAARFDPALGSVKNWILQCTNQRSLSRRQYLKLTAHYDAAYQPLAQPVSRVHGSERSSAR